MTLENYINAYEIINSDNQVLAIEFFGGEPLLNFSVIKKFCEYVYMRRKKLELGGFGAGVAYTFVRKLGKNGVRGPIIVMFFSTFSTLVCLPFFLMSYQPMTWKQLLFLLGAGLAATGGQLSMTAAYTYAPAKEISVYDYTQVIFAAIWGFCFFGQVPDVISIVGYVITIGAAVCRKFHLVNGTTISARRHIHIFFKQFSKITQIINTTGVGNGLDL